MDTLPRTNPPVSTRQYRQAQRKLDWKVFYILVGASIIALLPQLLFFLTQFQYSPLQIFLFTFFNIGEYLLITVLATGPGLWLGRPLGFGAPVLRNWLAGDPEAPGRFLRGLPLAIGIGMLAGIVFIGMGLFIGPGVGYDIQHSNTIQLPGWLEFVRAIEAAIREELWFRLGIMTVLIWLGTRIFFPGRVRARIIWISILLSAIAYGFYHLPTNDALTFAVAGLVILQNSLMGVVLGWIYWRRGLLLAMIANFCMGLVIHLIFPSIILTAR